MVTILRQAGAALLYFALVFGAGFAFGALRAAVVAPRLGERNAELAEAPLMLVTILLVGWLVSRIFRRLTWQELFGSGVAAAAMVLLADLAVGISLRGLTPPEILFRRDSLTGAVYYLLIGLYAVAPAMFALPRTRLPEEYSAE
ncbi:MAG TPA: hypothetical protein VGN57_02520 [Pirellulaceae bacterium]|nr:hypothetical protein [Pirellulaceae bacterium]